MPFRHAEVARFPDDIGRHERGQQIADDRDQPDNGVEPDWPVDAGHDEGALQNRLQRLDPPADGGRVVSVASHHPSEIIDLIRSEEHTSELQSLMSISYAVFCLKNTT